MIPLPIFFVIQVCKLTFAPSYFSVNIWVLRLIERETYAVWQVQMFLDAIFLPNSKQLLTEKSLECENSS